ncbi:alpha-N-acetylgalactosaminide alpha-2,6-sialyltransferase 6 [Brienomyrus brachyistius]|uniref:alpha-N-acetylgalactosaminide alpha-2,6-sialyltransferase 6 n=1 Tax=Brienomyrus brachyistius TaxID=42636 RepID=UPI0020B406A7|nr:alpha-N-acetylgalactosaminide alpha-2,6-sialyltransferase 6 [Brienomyrus brachyistius]XP_048876474.1 alpha-N-acetylgalactosaminide alpha-2,6-sialyltransferase 6 [Brienomyrus brachyistius]XP_048876475.1 alpha-N-acetylgalactosaminide alpha-2,6-sialyltransferase 6 [Brienomyrus brachyistius]
MGQRPIDKHGQQRQKMVILATIFLITTLLILLSSNSGSEMYSPFHNSFHHKVMFTDLKKWAGKEGYVAVNGNKSMTLHCRQCALVTSSSQILGTGAGDEIDQTECVIRMNDAPTTGFEPDVGNRSTLRVVAHSSVFRVARHPSEFLNKTPDLVVVYWGPPTMIGKDSKGTLFRLIQRMSMTYSNLSSFTIAPSKMRKFDSLFQKETGRDRAKSRSWLSTGWFTMVIAIEICDSIHVYGMVPPNYCVTGPHPKRKMPYHYYKPRGPDECLTYLQNERGRMGNHHRFITEKQVFARWAKLYNITFSYPRW